MADVGLQKVGLTNCVSRRDDEVTHLKGQSDIIDCRGRTEGRRGRRGRGTEEIGEKEEGKGWELESREQELDDRSHLCFSRNG